MNDVENTEDPEITPVGGRNLLDASAMIIGGQQGIEHAFAPQAMPLHPVDKQGKGMLRRLDDAALPCLPPLAANPQHLVLFQGPGEATRIGNTCAGS